LNDAIVRGQLNGKWEFPIAPQLLVNDSLIVVTSLAATSFEAYYIVDGICTDDTTVATINIFRPSSAGGDASTSVCLYQPINLYDLLSGSVDIGGTWYDPLDDPLSNSQINAPYIPGDYNYDYIVSNGVCPADTAVVSIEVVDTCDWLSVGAQDFDAISVYPNPATDQINVVNPTNNEGLSAEILDMNGRIVAIRKELGNSSEGTIVISHLETGIYTLRIYSETGQKMFKIVKK
jgi:hypothetical protein